MTLRSKTPRATLPDDMLLSYDQALAILHAYGLTDLDRKWLCNQVDRRMLKCTVVRRQRRFLKSEIEALVATMFAEVA